MKRCFFHEDVQTTPRTHGYTTNNLEIFKEDDYVAIELIVLFSPYNVSHYIYYLATDNIHIVLETITPC